MEFTQGRHGRERRESVRPASIAALANGLVVMAVAWLLVYFTGGLATDHIVRARPITPLQQALGSAARATLPVLFVTPLAAVVVWRTWVHALRYLAGESQGWRSVLDGAVVGALIPAALLLPAILLRLSPFSPGGVPFADVLHIAMRLVAAGLSIGAGCALVLRLVAVTVLWGLDMLGRRRRITP